MKSLTKIKIIILILFLSSQNAFSAKKDQEEKQELPDKKKIERLLNRFFDNGNKSFFKMDDTPFKEMDKIKKSLRQHFKDMDKNLQMFDNNFDSFFNDWYGDKYGGTVGDITQTEDKKFIIYKIKISGLKENQIDIKVVDEMVHISGTISSTEKTTRKNFQSQSTSTSSFKRSISIPPNTDYKNVKITTEKDTVILKFPKNKKK